MIIIRIAVESLVNVRANNTTWHFQMCAGDLPLRMSTGDLYCHDNKTPTHNRLSFKTTFYGKV